MTAECEDNDRNWDFVRKPETYTPVMFHHHPLTGETTTYATKHEAQPAYNWRNTFLKVP